MRPEASPDVTPSRDKRSTGAKVTLVVAVLVALAVVGGRWWTQPAVFGSLGDSFVAVPRPVAEAALSATVIFSQVKGDPETVTINGAEAVFSKNTAEATATFWICHGRAGEQGFGATYDPEASCGDLAPLEAGDSFLHGVEPDSDYLFVTITPTTPGVARLARVELSYARGARHFFQRGTESIGVDRLVVAR